MGTAIQFENVSKQYRIGVVGTGTLSHDLQRALARLRGKPDPFAEVGSDRVARHTKQEGRLAGFAESCSAKASNSSYVWALKNINCRVQEGDIVGIIGRNGAGKSTLLKLLSRVTAPTSGKIKARGRIASLLEVGTGFHPELTGRENIYLNGAILGMRRHEIAKKLDEIVEFSGCAIYIDTPVKRYSSGMTVRLGFAVAAHLDCEILVVDEVLAVGDAEFQKKCIGKMQEVSRGSGRTVLFVSHNMESMRQLTAKAFWIESGHLKMVAETEAVIDAYVGQSEVNQIRLFPENPDKEIVIRELQVMNRNDAVTSIDYSEPIDLKVCCDVNRPICGAHIAIMIRKNGSCVLTTGDADVETKRLSERTPGRTNYRVTIPSHLLSEGWFTVTATCGLPFFQPIDRHEDAIGFEVRDDVTPIRRFVHRPHPGVVHLNLPWHEL